MTGDRSLVDAVRARLADPAEVADLLGLGPVVKQAGGVLVCAPDRDDRNASCSLTVGPDGTLRVRDFGGDLSGDVLSLIAAVEGLDTDHDFPEVLAIGAELAGIDTDRERSAPRRVPTPRPAPPPRLDLGPLVAPLAVLGRLDGRNPIARDVEAYLEGRGLLDAARAAGVFALPPEGHAILVDVFGLEVALASGLVAPSGRAWVRPEHRLCLVWRGLDGHVTSLQRRRLDAGEPRYVSPTGLGPTAPFGAELLADAPADAPIAIVEGALDALALRSMGTDPRRIVLGVQGVNGWPVTWDALARGRDVWIAFDADEQGDAAAPMLRDRLLDAGASSVRRLRPEGAKDWAGLIEAGATTKARAVEVGPVPIVQARPTRDEQGRNALRSCG